MSTSVKLKGRALFDYKGNPEQRQVAFNKGDTINITNQYQNGWWAGEVNGLVGYFPATFVEVVDGAGSVPPPVSPKQPPPKIPAKGAPDAGADLSKPPPPKLATKQLTNTPSTPSLVSPKENKPPAPVPDAKAKAPPPVVPRNKSDTPVSPLSPTTAKQPPPVTERQPSSVDRQPPPIVERKPPPAVVERQPSSERQPPPPVVERKPPPSTVPAVPPKNNNNPSGKLPPPSKPRANASEADLRELDQLISQMENAAAELNKLLR